MKLQMIAQPDDVTCGPTSLYAVYRYLGYDCDLHDLIDEVQFLAEGGTVASFLGIDALLRGFDARIYSYNLHVFDPTWGALDAAALSDRLEQQMALKPDDVKLHQVSKSYIRFLELGGEVRFTNLSRDLLRTYFDAGLPVLAGLSATFLYDTRREVAVSPYKTAYDDLRGEPAGHFVVLCGFAGDGVVVADPYRNNPFNQSHRYVVDVQRLLNAIMLGIVTYDANLLIIQPKSAA